jgi:ABC-type multidrug transport system permease subunit
MHADREKKEEAARYWPLGQLVLARLREFYRQPERIFWVYGFPILTMAALGVAFPNERVQQVSVDIIEGPQAAQLAEHLPAKRFLVRQGNVSACRLRLRTGKSDLIVAVTPSGKYDYWFDPSRPASAVARQQVDDVLQRAAGRSDPAPTIDREVQEPGDRYIDFLVPGLLGAGLMGGGLWGVAFVAVDMRLRNLLKRLLATPMRKGDLLAGIMLSRLAFKITEIVAMLLIAYFGFRVVIQGSLWALAALIFLGAFTFSGIGLLVGSRARTLESVSGLMNAVMLPMWVFSGIFFSSDRFPAVAQPFIQALPLTALNNALRAVMLEGRPIAALWREIALLAAWAIVSFVLALRLFRWT